MSYFAEIVTLHMLLHFVRSPGLMLAIEMSIMLINYVHPDWDWKNHPGQKMINKVASTFQVNRRLQCMIKCTLSPTCDSFNYRPSDKTCELNTHDTQHTLDSCVYAGSGLVLLTRHVSSTHTTLHLLPAQPTSSLTASGPGGLRSSATSSKGLRMPATELKSTTGHSGLTCSYSATLSENITSIHFVEMCNTNALHLNVYALYLHEYNYIAYIIILIL